MISRRDFFKTAGLGVASLATALYSGSCTSTDYANRDDFSQFTHYLGNEWYNLPEDKKQETRELWKEGTKEEKEAVLDIYKSPQEKYNALDKNVQNNINLILEYQASGKKIKDSEKYQDVLKLSAEVPWINPDNLTKKDLIFLGTLAQGLAAALMVGS